MGRFFLWILATYFVVERGYGKCPSLCSEQAHTKEAILETGLVIQAPSYLESGAKTSGSGLEK